MPLATVHSRAQIGIAAPPIWVEVNLGPGLPGFGIVGLPETAVRESKDRVRAAMDNGGFKKPSWKITVSLAPADLPKEGARFDLPIALGVLAASGQVNGDRLEDWECLGELSLNGELRAVKGALPAALAARESGRRLILPRANGVEAGLVEGADVRLADQLADVVAAINGQIELDRPPPPSTETIDTGPDLSEVLGQSRARRALEICAAGGHNLLFLGPPGTGKTLLASRLPGILPPMGEDEALEAAAIASVAGLGLDTARWRERPFRCPHHTASGVALVGGGSRPRPGEISLAHGGVLFLDELPEYSRHVLEVLREPLESGRIMISRAALQAEFPARFQLVAAMNPCPCGYQGDPSGRCACTPDQIRRYRDRVSGPLLDRIDLQVEVPRQSLSGLEPGEPSSAVRARVIAARARQAERGTNNAGLGVKGVRTHCQLASEQERLLEAACERLQLSARAHHRILRVARTIADLDEAESIGPAHLSEAIGYRQLERRN
ncbi:YifB family Mg chelatase-like AAA ATPase [Wenzhouxiangella marina]|uniref:Magnesium chelatase, competence related protein (ComM) n=1 Tax=Wenzhouxiangella marina TaxID=1579979 RepID=A0A0K0XZI2_9GAMM|nr:YifB family Mg chelatase-like AAA ATPase [Wenzhouxiangella marina]AKS43080.1 Magnesium chelatase, competence related protein (ComM) [Wenzhouxiangella marina]MBB6087236.1 magnesium chelatase family protein [Wenzhouxiangella marina]